MPKPRAEGQVMSRDGWRAQVGLIVLANDTVAEPWLSRVVPDGITVHTARVSVQPPNAAAGEEELLNAVAMLTSAAVDVILYGCTSRGMEKGLTHETAFQRELSRRAGIPVVTAALSALEALRAVGASSIAILSPYPRAMEEVERRFFQESGLAVVAIRSLGLAGRDLTIPSPEQIYREAKSAWHQSADALFISCTNFRSQDAVALLEQDLGAPVVTSLTALLWTALRAAGVAPRVPGFGTLLEARLAPSY